MKKWPRKIIIYTSILFVAGNLFLIVKKDSKLDKIERLSKWEKVKTSDIQNKLSKSGIVIPEEEHPIYFDEEIGSFNQFLVKEGEEIDTGSPLFEYSSFNTNNQITQLETEISELEEKADHILSTIDQLEGLLTQAKKGQEEDQPEPLSIYTIQSDIYQKELEHELLLSEAAKLKEQVQIFEDQISGLTVKSPFTGVVSNVQESLSQPIMTISSKVPSIKGSLHEDDRQTVNEGMNVSVAISSQQEKMTGTISKVSSIPENESGEDQKSTYSFHVQLDDPVEDLLVGKHVDVDIILKESQNASVVPIKSIEKKNKEAFIYVLSPSGTIEKTAVQTGIKSNGKVEIVSGINKEEYLVPNAADINYQSGSSFTSPLIIEELSKKSLKKSFTEDWKYILKGFFAR